MLPLSEYLKLPFGIDLFRKRRANARKGRAEATIPPDGQYRYRHQRKPSPTPPLHPDELLQTTANQQRSNFFSKLPAEVRAMVYQELLKSSGDVVHVVKAPRKPLNFVRCRDICKMQFNYQCPAAKMAGSQPIREGVNSLYDLLPLLQTCRRL